MDRLPGPTTPIGRRASRLLVAGVLASVLTGCGGSDTAEVASTSTAAPSPATPAAPTASPAPSRPQALVTRVVREVPHDPQAFTQGLQFDAAGRLFESTGLEGRSTLREVDPGSGEVVRSVALDSSSFGEGIALVDGLLIQLTWQDEVAYVYDADTFEVVRTFDYDGEGWGLCLDGTRLVASDGSSQLTFRDPQTFEPLGSVAVTADGVAVDRLNELECVDGEVYANVFQTDEIVLVDLDDGLVTATIDASSLPRPADADVLNGIAVAPDGGLWLTGKLWPALYEVELVPAA